jgi:N-acetylmuramoyl-L-alanine amidase-like
MNKSSFLGMLLFCLLGFTSFASCQAKEAPKATPYDAVITDIYHHLPSLQATPIDDRIALISALFLGKPYELGPLGEGSDARFDQQPLYRTDKFDCLTYVETVLALAYGNNLSDFQHHLLALRYADGQPSFVTRNHFMSVDWIPSNTKKSYVRDITDQFVDEQGRPLATMAVATIDKPNWYRHFTTDTLTLKAPLSTEQEQTLLNELQTLANQVQTHQSKLPYLPLTRLFNAQGEPQQAIFDQIPNGAIINIVRPNWDLYENIGTHLNVSHTGFAIRSGNILFYREASTTGEVIDIPLTDYLQNYLTSSTIKGINVLQVEER